MNCELQHTSAVSAASLLLNNYFWTAKKITEAPDINPEQSILSRVFKTLEDIKDIQQRMQQAIEKHDRQLQELAEEEVELLRRLE